VSLFAFHQRNCATAKALEELVSYAMNVGVSGNTSPPELPA
jgi:hypothetical protein